MFFLTIFDPSQKGTKLRFATFSIILLGILAITWAPAHAQCVLKLSGKITDGDTREVLEGATIKVIELRQSTISGKNGEFQLTGLCPGNYDVELSHADCKTIILHIHIKEDLVRNFQLPHNASQLAEVVVVGSGRVTSTGVSDEVKGKALESTRGLSLGESLKGVTGVSVMQTGTNIYKPVIHGLHSSRVLILNNGIRQEGQQWGSEHAPEIDPYIANRITVIKGASSIRYGGDAIGGVILVEPKLLRYVPGVSGELNLAAFSNNYQGVFSGMIEGNSARHPAFAWRLQGTAKRGGNARTPGYWLANSGIEEFNGSATAGWRKEQKGIELFYSIFNTRLGIFAGSHIGNVTDLIEAINSSEPPDYIKNAGFTYNIERPYQQVQHHLFKARAFSQTGDKSRLNLVLSGQYNRRREYDIVRTNRTTPQLELNLFTGLADLVWDHFGGKKFKGTMGISSLYQNNSYSYRYFIPNYQIFNTGAFVAEKYQAGKWQIEGGIRYDYRTMFTITDNDKAPNDKLTGNAISPGVPYGTREFGGLSGNLGTAYKWDDHWQVNLTLASAWRAPQANEIFSDGLHHGAARIERGDLNLTTERANSMLAGLQFNSIHFTADLGVYVKYIQDFIYLKPTYPPQLTIRGAFPTFEFDQTNARLSGIDLNTTYIFTHHIKWTFKASVLRAYDRTASDWLIQMPADRMENALEYLFSDGKKWKQSYVKISLLNVARQTRVPESGNIEITNPDGSVSMESDYAPPPPGYALTGLEAGTELNLKGRPLTIIIGATNLFDVKYRDYMNAFRYYADDMGRNISLRMKIPFDFR